jgi:hypothetical protein
MLIVVCARAVLQSDRAIARAVAKQRTREAFRETTIFISRDIAAQRGVCGSEKADPEQELSICVCSAASRGSGRRRRDALSGTVLVHL